MALTKVSTGVVDMSGDTGGLVIAKGNGTDVSSGGERPTCNPPTTNNLGSIRENTTENKVEVCTSTGWQFLEEVGPTAVPLVVDYLIVAGGGGAGAAGANGSGSGGGGAGGLLTSIGSTALTLTPSVSYTIKVGQGGSGAVSVVTPRYTGGDNGSDSEFSGTGITQ